MPAVAIIDLVLVICIPVLAVLGCGYRAVYIAIVAAGLLWWFCFHSISPTTVAAQALASSFSEAGMAGATGGLFGAILFRKRNHSATAIRAAAGSDRNAHRIAERPATPVFQSPTYGASPAT
jgi:hypothetical protein